MGNQLIHPVIDKVTSTFRANDIIAGISEMQGFRNSMEDTHIATTIPSAPDHTLFAVFDGHGGDASAKFAKEHFVDVLSQSAEWLTYLATRSPTHLTDALTNCFIRIDADMRNDPTILESGSTAVVVIVTPTLIVCANAGDSRAVMSQFAMRHPIALSHDHKPDNPDETTRIEANGGFVNNGRVNGNLAVSRAFGDFELKPMVSCSPDFEIHMRNLDQDEMLIVACDGLWDVFSNEEAINEVRDIFAEGESDLTLVAEEILDKSLMKGSRDNVTAIVVKLSSIVSVGGGGGGVAARRQLREQESSSS
jgi:serine/threonine protein phosphatase PrpC